MVKELEAALRDFEPRLVRESIKARRDETVSPEELRVRFSSAPSFGSNPMNVPVEFAAEVELDSGKIRIDRL